MIKPKVIRLDSQGVNKVMEVGGPSTLNTTINKRRKIPKHKPETNKLIEKPTKLTIHFKHALRSPVSVELDSFSSEYSDQKWLPYGQIVKPLQLKKTTGSQNHAELSQPRP
jgi:hypothetical protein